MSMLGTSWPVLLGLTLLLFGGAAWMTGQALAETWRPAWQILPYGLLLSAGDRFFDWALFRHPLGSLPGFVLVAAILLAVATLAYRATRARKLVRQYPWLYERHGLFRWRAPPE